MPGPSLESTAFAAFHVPPNDAPETREDATYWSSKTATQERVSIVDPEIVPEMPAIVCVPPFTGVYDEGSQPMRARSARRIVVPLLSIEVVNRVFVIDPVECRAAPTTSARAPFVVSF